MSTSIEFNAYTLNGLMQKGPIPHLITLEKNQF